MKGRTDGETLLSLKPQLEFSYTYRLNITIFSLLYAFILTCLPLEAFLDRTNYLEYAGASWEILLRFWKSGFVSMMANEPLWLLMNTTLALVLPPEAIVRFFIFVPAVLVAYNVLRTGPRNFVWLLLILLVPSVIKNHIIHLRQGVAVSVFMVGWFTNNRSWRLILYTITPFIHSSFFFVLALLAIGKTIVQLRFASDLRMLVFLAFGLEVGVALHRIAMLLGARQATEYQFTAPNVSGLGFVFWVIVFLILCLQGKRFMRTHTFELGAIVFYLSTYFLVEVTARIFESALIPVLLAGLQLSGWRRLAFCALLVCYTVLSYAQRVGLPWLGWGVG